MPPTRTRRAGSPGSAAAHSRARKPIPAAQPTSTELASLIRTAWRHRSQKKRARTAKPKSNVLSGLILQSFDEAAREVPVADRGRDPPLRRGPIDPADLGLVTTAE